MLLRDNLYVGVDTAKESDYSVRTTYKEGKIVSTEVINTKVNPSNCETESGD